LLLRTAPLLLVAASIEQSKEAERSLQGSEQRFRNLANIAPVLLWVSGRIRDFLRKQETHMLPIDLIVSV
jgi:PAS domain-containing protein